MRAASDAQARVRRAELAGRSGTKSEMVILSMASVFERGLMCLKAGAASVVKKITSIVSAEVFCDGKSDLVAVCCRAGYELPASVVCPERDR